MYCNRTRPSEPILPIYKIVHSENIVSRSLVLYLQFQSAYQFEGGKRCFVWELFAAIRIVLAKKCSWISCCDLKLLSSRTHVVQLFTYWIWRLVNDVWREQSGLIWSGDLRNCIQSFKFLEAFNEVWGKWYNRNLIFLFKSL